MAIVEPVPQVGLLRQPAVRRYMLVCLLALLVVLVVLLGKGLAEWSLMPVLVGLVTLLLHTTWGPPALLGLVLLMFVYERFGASLSGIVFNLMLGRSIPPLPGGDSVGWELDDLLLAAALLAFLLGYYRIQGMVHYIFPVDPRRRLWLTEAQRRGLRGADQMTAGETRPMTCAEPQEIPWLVGLGAGWAMVVWLLWGLVTLVPPLPEFSLPAWRGLLLFWLAALGLLASVAILTYLRQASAGPVAAQIYLQDQLWQQTRREQSRLNRWLVWARLRAQRKKEGT